jgi:hypothetical protein
MDIIQLPLGFSEPSLKKKKHIRRGTPEERFWNRVIIAGVRDCWLWDGPCDTDGYGMFFVDTQRFRASRFAYMLANGPIPSGQGVLHHCDNPPCVNPAHLFLGTPKDNALDSVSKNRRARMFGAANASTKLTEDHVRTIRLLHKQGNTTIAALARQFCTSESTVRFIVQGKTWKHIL